MTTLRAIKRLVDATLRKVFALGTADGTTQSAAIDLGRVLTARGHHPEGLEIEIEAPALTTTELPDADTATYSIEMDTVSNFASPTVVEDTVIVQTGAGGAGAAAQTNRFRLPLDLEQFVRVKCVLAGGTGDCSGKNCTVTVRA